MYADDIERVIVASRGAEDGAKVNGMMADWVMQVSFAPCSLRRV